MFSILLRNWKKNKTYCSLLNYFMLPGQLTFPHHLSTPKETKRALPFLYSVEYKGKCCQKYEINFPVLK